MPAERPGPEEQDKYRGDLARLTALAGGALAFFGSLLLFIIAFAGWSANQQALERERTLVENAINHSIARALSEQKSVAWWDDAVTNITDANVKLDFADANFGVFLTETYDQDEVYILDSRNLPIYAFANAKRDQPGVFERRRATLSRIIDEVRNGVSSNLRQRPDLFGASQSNYRVLAGAPQMARWAGHVLSVDGRPAIVAAITIVPNVDMQLLHGPPRLLLSIVYLNDTFISDLGRSLLMPDLALSAAPPKREGLVSEPFVTDDSVMAGALHWTTRRPGHVLLTIILPLLSAGLAGAGVIFANMFLRLKRASAELTQSEQQARHESLHDALSGLPNRQNFLSRLEAMLAAVSTANREARVVAAYIDVDRFKDINDTMGHHAGDELIQRVAERLRTQLRAEDFLARFGGDEFAILCSSNSSKGGEILARRVAQAFSAPFVIVGQSVRVTTSVGIAVYPDNGANADELMRHADIALYEAKNQGRDRSVLFSMEMAERVAQRRVIEIDLRRALESDGLALHYQPIVSCSSGQIAGVEALLRWTHPLHGEIPPSVFVPIAEDSGLMPSLGDWVLKQAVRAAKRWPSLDVAVNLSPVQFRHADVRNFLHGLTKEYGVDPSRIVLEITEGVLMEANQRTKETMNSIRAMGFKMALDDFGTGYSSLAYLCQFKFDKIKIDRSFVSGFASGAVPRSILKAVVTLGQGLGMEIVAEGVETEFDALAMRHFGCTHMQGFFYSKAVPAERIEALIAAREVAARDENWVAGPRPAIGVAS